MSCTTLHKQEEEDDEEMEIKTLFIESKNPE